MFVLAIYPKGKPKLTHPNLPPSIISIKFVPYSEITQHS
ncbi:hypothetical protein P872_03895 [Rhodonellum psychrophilum GCM71 = DSM 17998]|uniref:Uncharacterized protein n=1 Tax=Rhodonellum psychrophilum GCM71 = DSM 17998 TaxID=1123057 RepID=U5C1L5_9BACT|nr:hypothetical protein P872_03895 [Rhodonellum psychrophilum GCM71 = DSM 17998]